MLPKLLLIAATVVCPAPKTKGMDSMPATEREEFIKYLHTRCPIMVEGTSCATSVEMRGPHDFRVLCGNPEDVE